MPTEASQTKKNSGAAKLRRDKQLRRHAASGEGDFGAELTHTARREAARLSRSGKRLTGRLEELVRDKPLVAVGGAAALGAIVGGLVISKAGRLVFLAAASFVATEVWRQEGKFDVSALMDRFAPSLASNSDEDDSDEHDDG